MEGDRQWTSLARVPCEERQSSRPAVLNENMAFPHHLAAYMYIIIYIYIYEQDTLSSKIAMCLQA